MSDAELKAVWKRVTQRRAVVDRLTKLDAKQIPSVSCFDVREALDFLYTATGDHIFKGAALAMKGYGLSHGGLKATVLGKIRGHRTRDWWAMPKMHSWVEKESVTVRAAAKIVAAEWGIGAADGDDPKGVTKGAIGALLADNKTPLRSPTQAEIAALEKRIKGNTIQPYKKRRQNFRRSSRAALQNRTRKSGEID